jgi:hypothetical protein
MEKFTLSKQSTDAEKNDIRTGLECKTGQMKVSLPEQTGSENTE